jgi:hypothetical protein
VSRENLFILSYMDIKYSTNVTRMRKQILNDKLTCSRRYEAALQTTMTKTADTIKFLADILNGRNITEVP